jgi:hypothetical protein
VFREGTDVAVSFGVDEVCLHVRRGMTFCDIWIKGACRVGLGPPNSHANPPSPPNLIST